MRNKYEVRWCKEADDWIKRGEGYCRACRWRAISKENYTKYRKCRIRVRLNGKETTVR